MKFINEDLVLNILAGKKPLTVGELNSLNHAIEVLDETLDACEDNWDNDVITYCERWLEAIEARVERSLECLKRPPIRSVK